MGTPGVSQSRREELCIVGAIIVSRNPRSRVSSISCSYSVVIAIFRIITIVLLLTTIVSTISVSIMPALCSIANGILSGILISITTSVVISVIHHHGEG